MSVATGYYVEQACLISTCTILLGAQLLQLAAECYVPPQRRNQLLGRLKKIFHRIAPCVTMLILIRCIDPWAVYGIFTNGFLELLADNASACLIAAACASVFLTIRSGYRIIGRNPPPILRPLAIFGSVLVLLAANAVGFACILKEKDGKTLIYGVWLLVLAMFMLFLAALFNWAVFSLRRSVLKFQDGLKAQPFERLAHLASPGSQAHLTNDNAHRVSKAMESLQLLQLGSTILVIISVALQFYVAIIRFTSSADSLDPEPTKYEFRSNSFFLWIQLATDTLLTWHSWIPLKFSFTDDDYLGPARAPLLSTTTSTASVDSSYADSVVVAVPYSRAVGQPSSVS